MVSYAKFDKLARELVLTKREAESEGGRCAESLAEAEATFEALTGGPRGMLGEAIGQFRAALETRNPEVYEPVREELRRLVAAIRQSLIQ
mgnify:CR=1 FL=1